MRGFSEGFKQPKPKTIKRGAVGNIAVSQVVNGSTLKITPPKGEYDGVFSQIDIQNYLTVLGVKKVATMTGSIPATGSHDVTGLGFTPTHILGEAINANGANSGVVQIGYWANSAGYTDSAGTRTLNNQSLLLYPTSTGVTTVAGYAIPIADGVRFVSLPSFNYNLIAIG